MYHAGACFHNLLTLLTHAYRSCSWSIGGEESSILGLVFQLFACQSALLDDSLKVPVPGVLWPSPLAQLANPINTASMTFTR